MGGGGGSGGAQVIQQAPEPFRPVNPVQLQTTGYGGMGPYPTPNPFTQGSAPSWANGWFSMPWWGTDAVTGQPLTQGQLQPPPPPPPKGTTPEEVKPARAIGGQAPYEIMRDQMRWEDMVDQLKQKEGLYWSHEFGLFAHGPLGAEASATG
jgi:hypothetical protein